MARILLVEDCAQTQILVDAALSGEHEVVAASSAQEATKRLHEKAFDLILLDVGLPDGSGVDLCATIRKNENTKNLPILFLTGKVDVEDRLAGFNAGGDDYIIKPFDNRELMARIAARLRRDKKAETLLLIKGDLKIDLPAQKAFLIENTQETDLDLTPNEFKILYCLVRNEGTLLSRDELLEGAWGKVHVLDRTIDKRISAIRKKLGPKSKYIQSIHGKGYRFLAS